MGNTWNFRSASFSFYYQCHLALGRGLWYMQKCSSSCGGGKEQRLALFPGICLVWLIDAYFMYILVTMDRIHLCVQDEWLLSTGHEIIEVPLDTKELAMQLRKDLYLYKIPKSTGCK